MPKRKADALIARMKIGARHIFTRSGSSWPVRIRSLSRPTTGSTSWGSARVQALSPRKCASSWPSRSWPSRRREGRPSSPTWKRAIRFGATREELFEVLETCLIPGGAPTFHRGFPRYSRSRAAGEVTTMAVAARGDHSRALRPRDDHRAIPRPYRHAREPRARGRLVAGPAAARLERAPCARYEARAAQRGANGRDPLARRPRLRGRHGSW